MWENLTTKHAQAPMTNSGVVLSGRWLPSMSKWPLCLALSTNKKGTPRHKIPSTSSRIVRDMDVLFAGR